MELLRVVNATFVHFRSKKMIDDTEHLKDVEKVLVVSFELKTQGETFTLSCQIKETLNSLIHIQK